MLRVGTVGTSWITETFIEAAQLLPDLYDVCCVYSRTLSKGEALAQKYQIPQVVDDYNRLIFNPEIDVIYIASPNGTHYEQAIRAIKAGKHLIVEKPMFSSVSEWEEAHRLADEMEVMIMEAVLHVHSQNYKHLKRLLQQKLAEKQQPFLGANLVIGQYSSKYPSYVSAIAHQEEVPNVFNLKHAAGTLMDIGVYPLYVAVDLFGAPQQVKYSAIKGPNGVDLMGTVILNYTTFQVSVFMSKAVHSVQPNEIYIDHETLLIENITRISSVTLIDNQGQSAKVIDYRPKNPMIDELKDFSEMFQGKNDEVQQAKYQYWRKLSHQVAELMAVLRESAGLTVEREGES